MGRMSVGIAGALALVIASCGGDDGPGPGHDAGRMDGGGTDAAPTCATGCDDGVFCNSAETCVDGTCQPGDPVVCNDGNGCTDDVCSEEAMTCAFLAHDADGDGHGDPACGGDDCDDADAMRYPGNTEVCDDAHDEDCDVSTYGSRDADGDMYDDDTCCNVDGAARYCGNDCDDAESTVHPSEAEICNRLDDDCNGMIDDGALETFYRDRDGDGYGRSDETTTGCTAPAGFAVLSGDCDDARLAVHPGAVDGPPAACDTLDNDCDGATDPMCPCVEGMTRMCGEPAPGGGFISTGECAVGIQRCTAATWGDCVGGVTAAPEMCNMLDDDCDGMTDDGVDVVCYPDADADHYAPAGGAMSRRCPDTGRPTYGNCPAGYTDRAPGTMPDCADTVAARNPGATEVCNGTDDDCDGMTDEMGGTVYYRDSDGDMYGDPASPMTACSMPMNYVGNNQDCNDTRADVSPDDMEVCDMGMVDENCNGTRNEGCSCTTGMSRPCGTIGPLPCHQGTQMCASGTWGACMGNVEPGTETCNMVDDDCDGMIDDGVGTMYYRDFDGDMYGAGPARIFCMPVGGYVADMTDCNDMDRNIHPLYMPEHCNGIDENCNGMSDLTDVGMAGCAFPHTRLISGAPSWCNGSGASWACQLDCQDMWRDCNRMSPYYANDADGCETDMSQPTHCGRCPGESFAACAADEICRSFGGSDYRCVSCGDDNQPCCAGSTCIYGTCSLGTCHCGARGEPCCRFDRCDFGSCSGGMCT